MRGWLAAGNSIAGYWHAAATRQSHLKRDKHLAWLAPQWSTAAIVRRNKIAVIRVPRLANWAERMNAVRDSGADVLISVHFPYRIPDDMLDFFGRSAVNLHPSPLPRYRGPTPTEAMILDRTIQSEAVMTLHLLTAQFDAGDIISQIPLAFPQDGDRGKYMLEMAKAARHLCSEALPRYLSGQISAEPQNGSEATYCRVQGEDMAITSLLTSEEVSWRCKTLGSVKPLDITGVHRAKIFSFGKNLGPVTAQPPSVHAFHVDMDAADARVRLKRKRPWTLHVNRARDFLTGVLDRDNG